MQGTRRDLETRPGSHPVRVRVTDGERASDGQGRGRVLEVVNIGGSAGDFAGQSVQFPLLDFRKGDVAAGYRDDETRCGAASKLFWALDDFGKSWTFSGVSEHPSSSVLCRGKQAGLRRPQCVKEMSSTARR